MEKEIKIVPPPGYVIDEKNSTLECIKFKRKSTYENVAEKLFANTEVYYSDKRGIVINSYTTEGSEAITDKNNSTSPAQVKKLLALNMLINVAKYLNGDWTPDFCNRQEEKCCIVLHKNRVVIRQGLSWCFGIPYFKTPELAEQAIEILGEEMIKTALSCV